MTRSAQKDEEWAMLRAVLLRSGINAEVCAEGECPDFMLQIESRTVGVEVTMFHSDQTIGSGKRTRRSAESEWERLESLSKEFRSRNVEMQNIYILFRFKGPAPSSKEHKDFCQEALEFIRSKSDATTEDFKSFGATAFVSPLMSKYLKPINGLTLKISKADEWDSNLTAGFVDGSPAQTISRIVTSKAAKAYRKADELWLVIGQSGRPSEIILPTRGSHDFDENLQLRESLALSPFSRVYVLTAMGLISWGRDKETWRLN